jgi:hypothetical protein
MVSVLLASHTLKMFPNSFPASCLRGRGIFVVSGRHPALLFHFCLCDISRRFRLLLIVSVTLEANPFFAGAFHHRHGPQLHCIAVTFLPGILEALDVNWSSISSQRCADGDAGLGLPFFVLWF